MFTRKIVGMAFVASALGASLVSAAFQPSSELSAKVDLAGNALVRVADTKLGGDYGKLLSVLKGYESKIGADEQKQWIFGQLINIIQAKKDGTAVEMFKLEDTMMDENAMENKEMMMGDEMTEENEIMMKQYETYSESAFEAHLDAGHMVVLNFRASRCPTCKATSEDIIANANELPEGVVVLEVDYDMYEDLRAEYDVAKQTTFAFIDSDGSHKKTVSDIRGIDDLLDALHGETMIKQYETYSESAFETHLDAGHMVVLNFRASRCPTCKATSEDIIANVNELPEGVVVLEVDYDMYEDLRAEYGVAKQTTFAFIDSDGSHKKTVSDIRGIDDLLEELK